MSARELTGVTHNLKIANSVVGHGKFICRIISDMPGLVTGSAQVAGPRGACELTVHAFENIKWSVLAVRVSYTGLVGAYGRCRRLARPVFCSGCATAFIGQRCACRILSPTIGAISAMLAEQGLLPQPRDADVCPTVTAITTSAGMRHGELVMGLIAPHLSPSRCGTGNRFAVCRSSARAMPQQPREILPITPGSLTPCDQCDQADGKQHGKIRWPCHS